MKFIDFFAGIGGFRRGMELAGHECVGFCEFDKFAAASYISMHLLTEEQRKALEDIPIKKRQKEILKEEYRNGEWYANDIRRVYAGDIPKADCWCFGFPCFAKGTYILTEKGYIPIEDVSVGDKVLTHKGRWRKVTATMHRDGARLWDVNGFGILPTRTTAEHPYYVTKPDQPMEFKKVEQLDDSWYSTMVLPDAESDGYSKEMWWIIGRYLADGWRVERKDRPSGGRIVFAISDDKRTEFEQRLREAKLHGTYTKERTCGKYHVCNNQLYEYLEKFGKYAHGKRIPREALCLSREKAKYFFDGYMSGDGRSDREEATSTSAALILGMCIIAQRLGKSVPAVYYTRRDEKCVIQGRECRQRDTYTFRISSKSVKGHYRARYVCRELYQPTESDDFGTVYNISVEEDNSYVANGAIVHNCQDISVAGKPRRVDYMQFIPENQCSISAIEKGIFTCYEIKSCKEDIYSGNGLNFIGEKNYLVTTMECYKEILPDLKNGKFAQHIRENFPECYAEIGNMGVMVAVPYQRDVAEEFESPTPLGEDVEKWRLSVILKCGHNGSRKRSMTELLFCMVRSGH